MEGDNLSVFFMKVHAVEEKFLGLSRDDKRKALRILEASLKKLQTLGEACQVSQTESTDNSDSPEPQRPQKQRVQEEFKHGIKYELHSNDYGSASTESSCLDSVGKTLASSSDGIARSGGSSSARSITREVTPCLSAAELDGSETSTESVRRETDTTLSVKNRNDISPSSFQAKTENVPSPRKRRKPQRLVMFCPVETVDTTEECKNSHLDDNNFDVLEDDQSAADDRESNCEVEGFSSKVHEMSSIVKGTKGSGMKCGVCSRRFKSEQTMKAHFRSHGNSPCTCLNCHQESVNYAAHLHHECKEKKRIKTSKNSRRKAKSKTAEDCEKKEESTCSSQGCNLCQICGKILKSEVELVLHMKRQHREPQRAIPIHECKFCGRKFAKRASVFIHFKQHAGNKMVCLKCGEFCENFDAYSEHMAVHNMAAKQHCTKCGMKFSGEQQLAQHMRCHDKFDCVLCYRHFTRRTDLFRHCRQVHGSNLPATKKSLQCQVCCRRFQSSAQLQQHSRIHTGERPVHCDVCRLWFRTPKSLNKHKKTRAHCSMSGTTFAEKDYLCSDCGKTFCRREAFRRHLLYHKGVRPHTCQYCGYRCQERNNLKRHIMLHFQGQRNFVCEVCGAAFHAKKTLQVHHSYKHSSDRSFPCPHCPLSFKAKNALMRHSKVHTKVKEHRCWCGAAFNRQYNLRRHMRTVHGSDHSLPPLRKVTVLDAPPEDKDSDKGALDGVGLQDPGVDYQPPDSVGALLQHPGPPMDPDSILAAHTLSSMVLPPQTPSQQPPLQQELGGEVDPMHYHAMPPQVSMADYEGAGGVEMAPPAPPRQQDYYGGGGGMMMDGGSTPVPDLNQYMYIQNILLPSVAMAGLMDLSNSGK